MPITALPPAPLPADTPSEFNTKSFNLVAALADFVSDANTLQTEVNAKESSTQVAASAATTKANEASVSASNAGTQATAASNWAIKTDTYITGSDNSAKSWAVGGSGTGQPSLGDSKSWATRTGSVVSGTEYSAKEYAIGTVVESAKRHASGIVTTGSAKDWATKTTSPDGTSSKSSKSYASDSATSAGAAAVSASESETSRIQASKLNLGNKTTDPVTDNQGDAILAGATYYNTSLNKWRVWSSTAWVDGISSIAGVSSFNGEAGSVLGVSSINGQTGTVTGIATSVDITAERIASATLTNKTITFSNNTLIGVQPTLVSGTNIKTVNNQPVLGTGNLDIPLFTLAQAHATALLF